MAAHLENIVIDSLDPDGLARFWSQTLNLPISYRASDEVDLRLTFSDDPDGFLDLCIGVAQEVPAPPHRIHLDLYGADQQQQVVRRALRAGGQRLGIGLGEVPWVVLADPQGYPFRVRENPPAYVDTGPLAALLIDAADPETTAAFWAAASGWVDSTDAATGGLGYVVLRHPSLRGPLLEFCPVNSPKPGKNPIHLDLRAVDDAQVEVERLKGLGAQPVEHDWGELPWTVFVDPAGNEFCLLPPNR